MTREIPYQVVGIHGAPRSGTSWLGQLFNSNEHVAYRYQPFFSYAFRGRIDVHSDVSDIRQCMDDLLTTEDDFVIQSGSARLARDAPQFTKLHTTHLIYKEVRFHDLVPSLLDALPDAKFIGVVRDPRAVLASWFNAPREFKPEWSQSEEWLKASKKNADLAENWYGYERWKHLASRFLQLASNNPARFYLMCYEDLVTDTRGTVNSLFRFCGIRPSEQTTRFIAESTSRDDGDPYGVFRVHGFPIFANLPSGIAKEIERDLAGTSLARFLFLPSS